MGIGGISFLSFEYVVWCSVYWSIGGFLIYLDTFAASAGCVQLYVVFVCVFFSGILGWVLDLLLRCCLSSSWGQAPVWSVSPCCKSQRWSELWTGLLTCDGVAAWWAPLVRGGWWAHVRASAHGIAIFQVTTNTTYSARLLLPGFTLL